MMAPLSQTDVDAMQRAIADAGLDGWLFYDFRGSDPIARKILDLDPELTTTRRWFYFVPSLGEPVRLEHAIESQALAALPGDSQTYLSWESLQEHLEKLLTGCRRIAMQHSPRCEVPYIARVDGGTLELVRSAGVQIVSSADLVQQFDATLTDEQLASHRRAAATLRSLIDVVFSFAAERVSAAAQVTERDILEFLTGQLDAHGLVYDHEPIVAVNANAADPHFAVPASGSEIVRRGDLLLVDVWAKERAPKSIYADITWTAVLESTAADEIAGVFAVVRDARDLVVDHLRDHVRAGKSVRGFELDRIARDHIGRSGYGDYFIHRTGHSIHEEGHGNGANLDDLETHDSRVILPHTLFSVEPGIYLPGRFGIRSEINVYHAGDSIEVTGGSQQTELLTLL